MLAILERIRQAVAAKLAQAKALIDTYKPVAPAEDVSPETPSDGGTPTQGV